nr:hypothetical protein [Oscillochloris trichoides]
MHSIQRMLLIGMLTLLWGCAGAAPPPPSTEPLIKHLGNSIAHIQPQTRQRDLAVTESLYPGQVGLSSEEGGQYRLNLTSGDMLLAGAVQSNPLRLDTFPRLSIRCPTKSGGSNLLNSLGAGGMVTCSPQFATGTSGEVLVSMEHSGSAVLFTLLINQGMQSTFDSLNLVGVSLAANTAQLYRINNTNTNVQQRQLNFSSPSSNSAALLYREDGRLICSSLGSTGCGVYDSDWSRYYLVLINTDAAPTTYAIRFSS